MEVKERTLMGFENVWNPPGKSIRELANELGVPYHRVQYQFHKWCKLHGYHPSEFHNVHLEPSKNKYLGFTPKIYTSIPPEAVEWIKEQLKRPTRTGPILRGWSTKKILEKRLGKKIITTVDLSKKYGIKGERIRREFKWWCFRNNKKLKDFYQPGVGYALPQGFIEWFEKVVVKREVKE